MAKHWLCRIGLHKYKIVRKAFDTEIRDEVRNLLTGINTCTRGLPPPFIPYYQKVCMRKGCDHIIDEITPIRKRIMAEYTKNKAEDDAAREKFKRITE